MKMAGFYFDFQRHSETQSIYKNRIGGMITRYGVFWNFIICKSMYEKSRYLLVSLTSSQVLSFGGLMKYFLIKNSQAWIKRRTTDH